MSVEKNKATLLGLLQAQRESQSAGNPDVLDRYIEAYIDPGYICHSPDRPELVKSGLEGARQLWHQSGKNAGEEYTINDMFGEGDNLALRVSIQSTNISTGESDSYAQIHLIHFQDGKIEEEWVFACPEH